MSVLRRVDTWMFAPAPAERLAVLRILTGLVVVGYLIVRYPAFLSLTDASPSRFEPVGVLSWLDRPFPDPLYAVLIVANVGCGVAFVTGLWFRWIGPIFALLLLVVTTYRSSWGQLLYFENLMVIHVAIIGLGRSADALVPGRRKRSAQSPISSRYGWPVRLAAVVTVLTYVLAGIAKLRVGGSEWMTGDTLRNHVAYSAARIGLLGGSYSPLARPLAENGWVLAPVAVSTVLIELVAPVALLGGRIRTAWVAATWLLHLGIAATMFVVFPYPLLGVAFAPLFRAERVVDRRRGEPGLRTPGTR